MTHWACPGTARDESTLRHDQEKTMLERQVGRRIIVIAALMTAATLATVVAFQDGSRQPGTVPPATPPLPLPSPVSTSVMVYKCDFNKKSVNIHSQSPQPSAVIGEGNPGDGFANLNSQGIYNYGTDIKTGVTGYVYFSYLTCGLVSPTDDATR
jgi:hypothetical protein